MITNFQDCATEAINELHDLNMDVVVNNDIPYYECTIEELVKYSNNFKIGIYYNTAQFAQFIYDKLIERFKEMGCLEKCYVSSYGVGYIKLNNGIIYRLVKTNINYRGYRFDKIYYQKGIDNNILNDIIISQLYGEAIYEITY